MKKNGFTLIEILVVIAIFAIISGFATVNLLRLQTKTSVNTIAKTLVSDIKSQQIKAMMGTDNSAEGIHFSSNSYTLFAGSSYNPADANNFTVTLDQNLIFSQDTFPGQNIIFSKVSGEVSGFANGQNSIVIVHSVSSQSASISINRLGAVTLQ